MNYLILNTNFALNLQGQGLLSASGLFKSSTFKDLNRNQELLKRLLQLYEPCYHEKYQIKIS